jgi:hypothetical protein
MENGCMLDMTVSFELLKEISMSKNEFIGHVIKNGQGDVGEQGKHGVQEP